MFTGVFLRILIGFLEEAAPYNIMIAKHDPFVSEERCDLFDVIDRNVSDFS